MYTTQEMQTRAGFLVVRAENLPEVLRSYDHWVLWRFVEGEGKAPFRVADPRRRASVRDSRTWSPFEECILRYDSEPSCQGVGFMFSSGDKLAGIDLDDVRDPETGELEAWAEQRVELARALGAYCELSASGTGVHLIGRFEKLLDGGKKGPVEAYTHSRFFGCTGWTI